MRGWRGRSASRASHRRVSIVVATPRSRCRTGILVAEFPVTVSDPHGPGGQLQFVETVVFNRSRGLLVATNRRPNVDHTYADRHVPPGASLAVLAGVGFESPPPRDELVIMVRVRLTDDRELQRTAALHLSFASAAYHSDGFGDLVKGGVRTLVGDGEIQWEAMLASE